MKKTLSILSACCTLLLFYMLFAIGGGQSSVSNTADAVLPSIGTVSSNSLSDLAGILSVQVPYVSLSGSGAVQDAPNGARLLRWQEQDGLLICAIRPASQAAQLRVDGLSLDVSCRWRIADQTAAVASDGSSACAYYSTQDAAYALYSASGGVQALENLMNHLSFTDP